MAESAKIRESQFVCTCVSPVLEQVVPWRMDHQGPLGDEGAQTRQLDREPSRPGPDFENLVACVHMLA